MQNDEVIWQVINHQFCSFKTKIARERTFCTNPHNVTGLCLRSACPLANSQYATVREEDGFCYLYMKTIERAHTPNKLWEKIRLPDNYMKALEIVSKQLEYFPKYLVHRNKQRLTKIHQMLIRMRKLKLKLRPKLTTINTKIEQREKGREAKALKAAQLDKAIEKELLERLKAASAEEDNEILNYPETNFQKILSKEAKRFQTKGAKADQLTDPDAEKEEEDEDEEREYELEEEEEDMSELASYEELEGEMNDNGDEGDDGEYNIEYIEVR
jgi:protein MAK16